MGTSSDTELLVVLELRVHTSLQDKLAFNLGVEDFKAEQAEVP